MNEKLKKAIYSATYRLLKPLALALLKQGVSYGEFSELARRAYIDAAGDMQVPGRKQSVSRIAVLTGINRKEVARLQKMPDLLEDLPATNANRAYRVINGWLRDPDFSTDGTPEPLPLNESAQSFATLVKRHSGDIPWRAVLDELQRLNMVQTDGEQVILNQEGYIPPANLEEKFHIMGRAARDLLATIEHNLEHEAPESRLQRVVAYNDLPESSIETVRLRSHAEAEAFLRQANQWLAAQSTAGSKETDSHPDKRVRAGIGIYYFEDRDEPEPIGTDPGEAP